MPLPLGSKPSALARAIGIRPTPAPRGRARVSVTKARVPRDTKTGQPCVDARKAFGAFSNAEFALRGIEIGASDILDHSLRVFAMPASDGSLKSGIGLLDRLALVVDLQWHTLRPCRSVRLSFAWYIKSLRQPAERLSRRAPDCHLSGREHGEAFSCFRR